MFVVADKVFVNPYNKLILFCLRNKLILNLCIKLVISIGCSATTLVLLTVVVKCRTVKGKYIRPCLLGG